MRGAVTFRRVLGSSPGGAIIKLTVTTQKLCVTCGALLRVAAQHVKLALEYPAIMTGLLIRAPVVSLRPIWNSRNRLATARIALDALRFDDARRPPLNHTYAAVFYKTGHYPRAGCCLTGRA